jgi:hypothetical protein
MKLTRRDLKRIKVMKGNPGRGALPPSAREFWRNSLLSQLEAGSEAAASGVGGALAVAQPKRGTLARARGPEAAP